MANGRLIKYEPIQEARWIADIGSNESARRITIELRNGRIVEVKPNPLWGTERLPLWACEPDILRQLADEIEAALKEASNG